jgi:hypothetical protein
VSSLSSFAVEAFEDHLQNISVDVVYDGRAIKALPANAEVAPELDYGGITDNSDGALIFKKSDFEVLPKVGSKIIIDGVSVRIRALLYSVGDPLLTVEYSGQTQR